MFENISYEVTEGIAEILLDRPDVMNAFHENLLRELDIALEEAMTDDAVYVVVLSGNGEAFCSGGDLQAAKERNERLEAMESHARARQEYMDYAEKAVDVVRSLYKGPKPTVAAVNGPAIGPGCDFALASDLRVMSETAVLREQFVNVGMVAADGGGLILPRLIGESKAKEYLLTGRDITAEDAQELGLVTEVVETGRTLPAARELAIELRNKPAKGMRETKSLIGAHQSFEEYATRGMNKQWEARNDPEQAEAVRAFVAGRDPDYDREY